MPGGDRTGPEGMGPRTGRSAGYCGGSGMPGFANPVSGRGFGAGWIGGVGRGRGGGGGRGFGLRRALWGRGLEVSELGPAAHGFRDFGGGFRGGRPGGRGWRHRFFATGLPGWARGSSGVSDEVRSEQEREWLARQEEVLQAELETVRRRLANRKTGPPAGE